MANHQQHTTFSTASGLIFGTLAWYPGGFPAVTCLLAGGLCGMGGMLPDIDIKTSRSFHDCMSITACIASMLVILRVSTMGVSGELVSIIGAVVFLAVKFGVGRLIQSFTKHRGLIHSIPFCILCGQIIFLITTGDIPSRVLKAAGLSLGFFSHLLLDEIYSVDVVQGKLNTKKSFGTAIKFGMTKHIHLTIVLYLLLCFATFIAIKKPGLVGESFDRGLDQIAKLTIQGAQHFEDISHKTQESLRINTNISRNSSPTSDNTDANDGQLAQADDGQDENRERRYEMPSMTQIAASVSAPTIGTLQPEGRAIHLRTVAPTVTDVTQQQLFSELERSRPNGRPLLLSEMEQLEQLRASGGYTSQLPPAMPIQ